MIFALAILLILVSLVAWLLCGEWKEERAHQQRLREQYGETEPSE